MDRRIHSAKLPTTALLVPADELRRRERHSAEGGVKYHVGIRDTITS